MANLKFFGKTFLNSLIKNLTDFKKYITRYFLIRRLLIILWHILGCIVTYILAFLLRFDASIPPSQFKILFQTLPLLCVCCVFVFAIFKLHSGIWAYFSINDLPKILFASIGTVALFLFLGFLIYRELFSQLPRSILLMEMVLLTLWTSGGRYVNRLLHERYYNKNNYDSEIRNRRIIIIGTLNDCDLIIRSNRIKNIGSFVGVITDNYIENNMNIHGLPVYYADINKVGNIIKKRNANYILILPPFNKPAQMNIIVESCSQQKVACQFHTIPSLADLISGGFSISCIKNVELEDLLGRGEKKIDRTILTNSIAGKKVMITGAGGSIGSELCRQIAQYQPSVIVLFETNEFSLYTIEYELKKSYPTLRIIPFAGDIRHEEEIKTAIKLAEGIDLLYHAAAYKHVPLMEENIPQCVRNNIIGTYRLAKVAQQCNVKRFIMISTDKAVRPSSIMGASKRIAEQIICDKKSSKTIFVAVRFGNVLGSSGSVVPLFKEQIKNGGPVTVTSPNIRRFFMTITEAVDLVLQAGAIGQRGEIMVLEMGNPVIIADMARKLIELSGLVPEQDIKIEYMGLRPGEKEYEEVTTEDENIVKTSYNKIWVMKKSRIASKSPELDIKLIERLVLENNEKALRQLLIEYIPENTFKK